MSKTPRRTALVTGASRGLGAAVVRELAAQGLQVVINHRDSAGPAEALAEEITAGGGRALVHAADVCDRTQARDMVARTVEEFGGLDVLVCNANVGLGAGSVDTVSWADFSGKVNAELAAAFHVTQAALPLLAARDRGRVVYLSSDVHRGPAAPPMAAHGVAKAALNSYARWVAKAAAPLGVGVNVLSPGLVRTEALEALGPGQMERFLANIPYGRAGEPADVARLVAYLADVRSEYLIGQIISLNGGSDLGR